MSHTPYKNIKQTTFNSSVLSSVSTESIYLYIYIGQTKDYTNLFVQRRAKKNNLKEQKQDGILQMIDKVQLYTYIAIYICYSYELLFSMTIVFLLFIHSVI